jgi:hypothetical protein
VASVSSVVNWSGLNCFIEKSYAKKSIIKVSKEVQFVLMGVVMRIGADWRKIEGPKARQAPAQPIGLGVWYIKNHER